MDAKGSFLHNALFWTLNSSEIDPSLKIWFRSNAEDSHRHWESMRSSPIYVMRLSVESWAVLKLIQNGSREQGKETSLGFYGSFGVEPEWGFLCRKARTVIIWTSYQHQRRKHPGIPRCEGEEKGNWERIEWRNWRECGAWNLSAIKRQIWSQTLYYMLSV